MRTITIDIGPHLLLLALLWPVFGLLLIALKDRRVRAHRSRSSCDTRVPVPAPADRRAAPRPSTRARANPPSPDIVSETCRIVGERYNVTVEDLLSPTRAQPIALARQVAMRLLRELTDLSYPQIAARFNRDHSTVVHAVRATDGMYLEDLREEIRAATGEAKGTPPANARAIGHPRSRALKAAGRTSGGRRHAALRHQLSQRMKDIPMSNNTTIPGSRERQCDRALHKANRVRTQRRRLRERIAHRAPLDGAKLVAKVLMHPPDYAQTMTVERLLRAVRGVGSVRAKAIAGPRSTTVLRALSTHDRVRIAMACQRHAAHLKYGHQSAAANPQQSREALDQANRVRLLRAQTLRAIASAPEPTAGAWRAAALINNPARPVELNGLTVKAVLEAIPHVESVTARKILQPLDLTDTTRLEMLSRSRSTQIATALIDRHSRLQRPTASTAVTDGVPARAPRALPAAA